jgi:hypothetical protein
LGYNFLSMTDPQSYFAEKEAYYSSQFNTYAKQYNKTSVLRVALFVAGAILFFYFANARNGLGVAVTVLISFVLFILLLKIHQRISYRRGHAAIKKKINEEELIRLRGKVGILSNDAAYGTLGHPYASDLDLFGSNSLFQHLNRSATIFGQDTLADWLLHPAPKATILTRQQQVKELSALPDWLQEFQALGKHFTLDRKQSHTALSTWLNSPSVFEGRRWVLALSFIMPLIALAAIVLAFGYDIVPTWVILIALGANLLLLKQTHAGVQVVFEQIGKRTASLKVYAALLKHLEHQSFKSNAMLALQQRVSTKGEPASASIQKLFGIVQFFESRANMFYMIIGVVFLTDHFLMLALDRWKHRYGNQVLSWMEAVDELDALCSLAGQYHANPEWCQPEIVDEAYKLEAHSVGHLLIPASERVVNDLKIEGKGITYVITGSNMSGKSTFMRTVGINTVLALAGGPVCAKAMRLSVMQVFTSMRISDSLEENISSFYAELRRIKQVLDLIPQSDIPVLYFLDEILKGTNSQDRHAGAKALIRQLHTLKATGFISTHDLELGQMEEEMQGSVTNWSFNSTIEDGKIYFDYKLTPGICKSFNALAMMKNMGIEV